MESKKYLSNLETALKVRESKENIELKKESALSSLSNLDFKKNVNALDEVRKKSSIIIKDVSEQLRKRETELIFIIDASTSCEDYVETTKKGYDDLITARKNSVGVTNVTTALFTDKCRIVNYRKNINHVEKLKYFANGNTCFYDTLCKTIKQIRSETKNRGIVAIMTDGEDNSSIKYDIQDVRRLISDCKKDDWIFLFFGRMLECDKVAEELGIDNDHVVKIGESQSAVYNSFVALTEAIDDIVVHGDITSERKRKAIENSKESSKKLLLTDKKNGK